MSANELGKSGRLVGYDFVPLVIADISINLGGSLSIAKQMANLAIESGIEVIM